MEDEEEQRTPPPGEIKRNVRGWVAEHPGGALDNPASRAADRRSFVPSPRRWSSSWIFFFVEPRNPFLKAATAADAVVPCTVVKGIPNAVRPHRLPVACCNISIWYCSVVGSLLNGWPIVTTWAIVAIIVVIVVATIEAIATSVKVGLDGTNIRGCVWSLPTANVIIPTTKTKTCGSGSGIDSIDVSPESVSPGAIEIVERAYTVAIEITERVYSGAIDKWVSVLSARNMKFALIVFGDVVGCEQRFDVFLVETWFFFFEFFLEGLVHNHLVEILGGFLFVYGDCFIALLGSPQRRCIHQGNEECCQKADPKD